MLIEYLSHERVASDPVERLGDDAVTNAAARALANLQEQQVFPLLMRLAGRPCLTGVIYALGAFRRAEAIPLLIDALEDDASRHTAEAALKRAGPAARQALVACANRREPSLHHESESSLRRRRSALKLLAEVGAPRGAWRGVRPLTQDQDVRVSVLACKICLRHGTKAERTAAIRRLTSFLPAVDWMLRAEIEDYLVAHLGGAR